MAGMYLSPAGKALNLDQPLGTAAETEEARRKRLAAIQANANRASVGGVAGPLSPAGIALGLQ